MKDKETNTYKKKKLYDILTVLNKGKFAVLNSQGKNKTENKIIDSQA